MVITGLIAGNLIGYFTEYYTSYTEKPTQGIARSAETGPATLIIEGLAVGMLSTVAPAIIVVVAVIVSYWLGEMGGAGPGCTLWRSRRSGCSRPWA